MQMELNIPVTLEFSFFYFYFFCTSIDTDNDSVADRVAYQHKTAFESRQTPIESLLLVQSTLSPTVARIALIVLN